MAQRIGDYGEVLSSEKIAGELIYFNRLVKYGTTPDDVLMADEGEVPCGAVEFDYRREFKDGTARTGWEQYETMAVKESYNQENYFRAFG
jgi:hypothetical protein